jgi:hypothetical protein
MKKLVTSLAWLALLTGCATTRLPQTSQNPFGGSAGTMFTRKPVVRQVGRQQPAFGPYQASDIRRGWTTTHQRSGGVLRPGASGSPVLDVLSLPYAQRLTTEDSKMQFSIRDDQGHTADVYTTTKAVTQSVISKVPLLGQLDPELLSKTTETFNAIIVGPQLGATNAWNLLLSTTNKTGFERHNQAPVIGLVGDEDQVLLRIKLVPHAPVTKKDGTQTAWPAWGGPGGIEILHNQQRVGFIDYSAAEVCVWLRDDSSPELRFLTATTLATLLMRDGS